MKGTLATGNGAYQNLKPPPPALQPFSIKDILLCFAFISAGLALSGIVFIFERVVRMVNGKIKRVMI